MTLPYPTYDELNLANDEELAQALLVAVNQEVAAANEARDAQERRMKWLAVKVYIKNEQQRRSKA